MAFSKFCGCECEKPNRLNSKSLQKKGQKIFIILEHFCFVGEHVIGRWSMQWNFPLNRPDLERISVMQFKSFKSEKW